MKILVFDNYDSFTYNLVHLIEKVSSMRPDVYRNDEITLEAIGEYDHIILSPGPGVPSEAGLLLPLIQRYASSKKILGVCLGHQAIAESFGAKLINLSDVYHGVSTRCKVQTSARLFKGLPDQIEIGRYHSWIVNEDGLPVELEITARDENGYIMALQHKQYDVQSVQFHPESVLTPMGEQILSNWISEIN
jgi:anthranilate synthase component 2